MAEVVYILCGLTSIVCSALLLRQYRLRPGRLLFWSAGCFVCLAISNVLLFVDMVLLPNVDLAALRNGIMLLGIVMLLSALIWEAH